MLESVGNSVTGALLARFQAVAQAPTLLAVLSVVSLPPGSAGQAANLRATFRSESQKSRRRADHVGVLQFKILRDDGTQPGQLVRVLKGNDVQESPVSVASAADVAIVSFAMPRASRGAGGDGGMEAGSMQHADYFVEQFSVGVDEADFTADFPFAGVFPIRNRPLAIEKSCDVGEFLVGAHRRHSLLGDDYAIS